MNTYKLISIPGGEAGTRRTLKIMRKIILQYRKSPIIRELALDLTSGLESKDRKGEIISIHRFVRDSIRYVRDIRGVETIQTPEATLRIKAGDCDDKATLSAALLESIGFKTRLMAVGFGGGTYSHVFTEVELMPGKWIPLECTVKNMGAGIMPKNITKAICEII